MKTLETDIVKLQGIKNLKKYHIIKIYEGWDNECLINYRLYSNNPKLTYNGAFKIFEKFIKIKGFKKIKSIWQEPTMSCSIFKRS